MGYLVNLTGFSSEVFYEDDNIDEVIGNDDDLLT